MKEKDIYHLFYHFAERGILRGLKKVLKLKNIDVNKTIERGFIVKKFVRLNHNSGKTILLDNKPPFRPQDPGYKRSSHVYLCREDDGKYKPNSQMIVPNDGKNKFFVFLEFLKPASALTLTARLKNPSCFITLLLDDRIYLCSLHDKFICRCTLPANPIYEISENCKKVLDNFKTLSRGVFKLHYGIWKKEKHKSYPYGFKKFILFLLMVEKYTIIPKDLFIYKIFKYLGYFDFDKWDDRWKDVYDYDYNWLYK